MASDKRTVQSVDRAVDILEILRKQNTARLTEISKELDLSPSTVHTYLTTLEERNIVSRDLQAYTLGPKLINFGESYRNSSSLYVHGRPEVDKIADETGDAVHLMIESDGTALILYEEFGEHAAGTEYHEKWRENSHAYLHCTGGGKAILANLPEDRRERVIERGLSAVTDRTITDEGKLREELTEIRHRGFSLADGEEIEGIRAVGAPIFDHTNQVRGAISLTSISKRLEGDRYRKDIPEQLMQSAELIRINIVTQDML